MTFLDISKEQINNFLKSFNELIISEQDNLFVLTKSLDQE